MNFGPYPMGNGLTRLASRFLAEPKRVDELKDEIGEALDAEAADELGLVTFTPDDIDWEDEVRLALEERAGFSPDALTGMEANLRFAGPETHGDQDLRPPVGLAELDLPAPNAIGPEGALKLYGTGKQAKFDRKRAVRRAHHGHRLHRAHPQQRRPRRATAACSARWRTGSRASSTGGRTWGRTARSDYDVYLRTAI